VVASYGFHATLVADSDTVEYRKHGAARFHMIAGNLLFPKAVEGPELGKTLPPHAYNAKITLLQKKDNSTGPESPGAEEAVVMDRTEHGYILASLVSNLEETFMISPHSQPMDGQLRLCHFGALSGEKTMEIMTQAYHSGKHVEMDEVGYEPIEGLRIDFNEEDEQWRRVCIDGIIVRVEKGGWMEVRKVKEGEEAVDIITL
jgi:hypothetical protein